MKRLVLRLSITAVFLACGVIAIAQSMKKTDPDDPNAQANAEGDGGEGAGFGASFGDGDENKPSRLKDDGIIKPGGIDSKVELASAVEDDNAGGGGAPVKSSSNVYGSGSQSPYSSTTSTYGGGGAGSSYGGGGSGSTYGGGGSGSTYGAGGSGSNYGGAATYGSSGSSYGQAGDSSSPAAETTGTSYGQSTGSSYGAGTGSTYGAGAGSYDATDGAGAGAGTSSGSGSVRLSDAGAGGAVGDAETSGGYGAADAATEDSATRAAPAPLKVSLGDGAGAAGAAAGAAAATVAATTAAASTAAGAVSDAVDTGAKYGSGAKLTTSDTTNTYGGAAGGGYSAGGYGTTGQSGGYGASDAYPAAAGGAAAVGAAAGAAGAAGVSAASQPEYNQQVTAAQPSLQAGAGRPGDEKLEGVQRPSLTIEKIAPREVQVGVKAKFEIIVKNDGRGDAIDVMVVDQTPEGAKLISTNPPHQPGEGGTLVWQLGDVPAGDSRTIELELMPTEERDELGSVARVLFEAQASARTRSTKPQLVIESTTPEKVLVGDDATLEFTIVNQGTGAAMNVVLLEDVPEGFSHPAGRELEYEIGTIRPNERYPVRLKLRAESASLGVVNRLQVKGEGQAFAEKQVSIDIVAPQLAVQLQGPALKYLNRRSKYLAAVANTGTAAERKVNVVVHLPKGVRFAESPNGKYDSRAHLVYWTLDQLDPQQQENFEFTIEPTEIGAQKLKMDAQGQLAAKATSEWETRVEGLSELTFTVADTADPIEFGKDTTYEIIVQNIGTKSDSNVNIVVGLPKGLKFKSAQGETRNLPVQDSADGQVIQFEPIAKMGPNDEARYRVEVVGEVEGDYRIGVQVSSDEAKDPVTREESTKVYRADR